MPKGFFKVENMDGKKVRIHLNGIIGDWGNASDDVIFMIENQEADEIEVLIQSPGGSAFEGIAIHNALILHPAKVTTRVLGAAASAASIIFMAGDERIMPENTYLMIHEPSLAINGKARELREAADFLDGLTEALLTTYKPRIVIEDEELISLFMKDSWINATDCLEKGFATTVENAMQAVALSQDFTNRFDNLPTNLKNRPISEIVGKINNLKDFENTLRESGCSHQLATALVSKAKTLAQSESEQELDAIHYHLKSFNLN